MFSPSDRDKPQVIVSAKHLLPPSEKEKHSHMADFELGKLSYLKQDGERELSDHKKSEDLTADNTLHHSSTQAINCKVSAQNIPNTP